MFSCEKEELNQVSSINKQHVDSGGIEFGVDESMKGVSPVAGFGNVITNGSTLISNFQATSPNWTLNFRLSESNYDSLISQTGAQGIAFLYAQDELNEGMQMWFAVDSDTNLLTDICLKGNSSGGESISLIDAVDYCDLFDDEASNHPDLIVFGKTTIKSILDQTDVDGVEISNAYEVVSTEEYGALVLTGYNQNGTLGAVSGDGVSISGYWVYGPCIGCVGRYWVSEGGFGQCCNTGGIAQGIPG
jgi:hypothetical protein